jgi:hypothetical protein
MRKQVSCNVGVWRLTHPPTGDRSDLSFFVGTNLYSVGERISWTRSEARECAVYRAQVKSLSCAVKVEHGWPLTCAREARALRLLAGCLGVPRLVSEKRGVNSATLVTEPLGRQLDLHLTPERARKVCMDLLEVLQGVHARCVVHLDISPDNVVEVGNSVFLIDWECFNTIGAKSSFVGKPRFASERLVDCGAHGTVRVSEADDIESVLHVADALLGQPRTRRVEAAKSYSSAREALLCIF